MLLLGCFKKIFSRYFYMEIILLISQFKNVSKITKKMYLLKFYIEIKGFLLKKNLLLAAHAQGNII